MKPEVVFALIFVYAFGLAEYNKDRFSSYDHQIFEVVGMGWRIFHTQTQELNFEAGVGATQSRLEQVEPPATPLTSEERDVNEFVGRLGADYKHFFGEKPYFQQILEYIPNFKTSADYRFNSESALVAPITGGVAIKVGYIVRYRGLPPEGFGSTDTTLLTGIQISN